VERTEGEKLQRGGDITVRNRTSLKNKRIFCHSNMVYFYLQEENKLLNILYIHYITKFYDDSFVYYTVKCGHT
jgi:hypothetical protein